MEREASVERKKEKITRWSLPLTFPRTVLEIKDIQDKDFQSTPSMKLEDNLNIVHLHLRW